MLHRQPGKIASSCGTGFQRRQLGGKPALKGGGVSGTPLTKEVSQKTATPETVYRFGPAGRIVTEGPTPSTKAQSGSAEMHIGGSVWRVSIILLDHGGNDSLLVSQVSELFSLLPLAVNLNL